MLYISKDMVGNYIINLNEQNIIVINAFGNHHSQRIVLHC